MKIAWLAVAAFAVHAQDLASGSLDATPDETRLRGRAMVPVRLGGGGLFVVGANAGFSSIEIQERDRQLVEGGLSTGLVRKDSASREFLVLGVRAGSEVGRFDAQTLQAQLAGGASWKVREGLSLGVGLAVLHRPDGNGLHPIVVLEWQARDDLRIRGRLPAQASMEWALAPQWFMGARWSAEGGCFAMESDEGDVLRIQRLALEGFARRRFGHLALEGTFGWLVRDRILRVAEGDGRWSVWSLPVAGSRTTTILADRTGPVVAATLSIPVPQRR